MRAVVDSELRWPAWRSWVRLTIQEWVQNPLEPGSWDLATLPK